MLISASLRFTSPNSQIALAELPPVFRVGGRLIDRLPHARDVTGAELHASEIEDVERDSMSLTDRPEHVLDRHRDVVEHQDGRRRSVEPEFLFVGAALHAHAALDDEGGEVFAVDLREDREEVGKPAVGDPRLLSVQHVVTAIGRQPRGGLRGERVGARLRLGQRIGADPFAAGESREISGLLVVGAEIHDGQRADRRMGADRPAERWIQGDVFEHIRGADLVQPEAAVGFRNLEAQQIECGSLLQQFARERPIVRVQTVLVGKHFVPHELRRRPAEQQLFVGELVAREKIVRIEPARQKRRTSDLSSLRHRGLRSSS